MSWFDTTGFASIAKSALKEAQRTIDKALDIKEDSAPTIGPVDTNSEDFFAAWENSATTTTTTTTPPQSQASRPTTETPSSNAKTSIWGSFTGSFFDPYNASVQPLSGGDPVDNLDDSIDNHADHFTSSKLVVQPSDEIPECDETIDGSHDNTFHESQEKDSPQSVEVLTPSDTYTTPDTEVISSDSITEITTESIEVLRLNEVVLAEGVSSSYEIATPASHYSTLETPDSIEALPEDNENALLNIKTAPVMKHKDSVDKSSREVPITQAPSRVGMHLPLQQILISNIIDIPQDAHTSMTSDGDESSHSEKTLVASGDTMESSSDTSTTTDSNTSSLYLKSMLADAMSEKRDDTHFMDLTQSMLGEEAGPDMLQNLTISQLDMPPRETSPLSSESRSDMVKVGSDQTSGHTSGDEVETTTSSDIEVISSPNGESSSTHSRHSPAKLTCAKSKSEGAVDGFLGKITMRKIMGHHRELSDISNTSEDCENDLLVKRLTEVTQILELRENKLIETSRKLSEVQEQNNNLQKQLDAVKNRQVQSEEMAELTEKYSQRLSALEKKFQQAIRDKDVMRKQLDQCKEENAVRLTRSEFDNIIEEREQMIKELREEGEKLSKQQLQHSNIIKKLRLKEKEHEQTIKHLKDSLEDSSSETERLKRSLGAKDEVERTQIEAIHQLTARNKNLEFEVTQLQGKHDDMYQKHETIKLSLDAAKKELIIKNKTTNDLQQREQLMESLENSKRLTESQNEEILNQLEDLRFKIREAEQEAVAKEAKYRSETAELMRRLESAESRNEELSQSVMDASKPLVRQLEALQATHNFKVANFEKTEQNLNMKISELQHKLQNLTESSKGLKDDYIMYKNKANTLQMDMESIQRESQQVKVQIDHLRTEKLLLEQTYNKDIDLLKETTSLQEATIKKLQSEIDVLKMTAESIKSEGNIPEEQQPTKDREAILRTTPPGNQSPTASIGRASICSLNSSLWLDENIDFNSSAAHCTNMLEMQMLQTTLKQRDGDVQQLQWELNRREYERTLLNTEISRLIAKVEELQATTERMNKIEKEFADLKQQYDTLCQLYGEKVEENEELKLDLVDVKDMYKAQIDELLKQQRCIN